MIRNIKNAVILWITRSWNKKYSLLLLLWPFSKIYQLIVTQRYLKHKNTLRPGNKRAPIVVVGNLTVGGAGKTPCIIALARWLTEKGYRPGIVSRGYGGESPHYPYFVLPSCSAKIVGDEAALLSLELALPLVIDPIREQAVDYLLANNPEVNIVLCDDGLQHLALSRDIEIVVVDAVRKFGNGLCLPAGPLREPISRLKSVDLVISQGLDAQYPANFTLEPQYCVRLTYPYNKTNLSDFIGKTVHAVAAIGNPERFFVFLEQIGLTVIRHPLPDHTWLEREDLVYNDEYPVLMTAKDAVKCKEIAHENCWYLQVKPVFNAAAEVDLEKLFKK